MADAAVLLDYGVPVQIELLWKSWDDGSEHVVYHPRSGHTHLLDELSAWVVKLLQTEPLSRQSVSNRIVREFGPELDPAEVERFLAVLLPQLIQLGLVGELLSCD